MDVVAIARARAFLRVHTILLMTAFFAALAFNLTGLMGHVLATQSMVFCAGVGIITAAGWWLVDKAVPHRQVVMGMLYADSLVGMALVYAAGEFEASGLCVLMLCVMMAPLFGGRSESFKLAGIQLALFSLLLAGRTWGWFDGFMPYRTHIPMEALREPSFVLDSWLSFALGVMGAATLAGQASTDIVNSKEELEVEVAAKTRALENAKERLAKTNTELASANQDLALANARLIEGNQRLDQFNAAVSHDLRAPLQALVARAELIALTGKANPDRIPRMADEIIETATRMGRQIDELMKLSRLGTRLGESAAVSLDAVAAEAIQDLMPRIRQQGAAVRLNAPLEVAWGNPVLLKEVFQNLIENALKYGRQPGPKVIIENTVGEGGRVAVAIEDDGPGIPEIERHRVFKLFHRMRIHQANDGVGAGLAIVQRIIEVHGGDIRVEAGKILGGARFVLELRPPPSESPATSVQSSTVESWSV